MTTLVALQSLVAHGESEMLELRRSTDLTLRLTAETTRQA